MQYLHFFTYIMEAQTVTLLVFLDLSAAFDTVRHETLLSRLRWRFGVDGNAVDVNGGVSSTFPLKSGVP